MKERKIGNILRKLLEVFSLLAIAAGAFCFPRPVLGQEGPEVMPAGPVPVVEEPVPFFHRVPARLQPRVIRPMAAAITVNYKTAGTTGYWGDSCQTFPASAQTAFNYAVGIWEGYLNSLGSIFIEACWSNMGSGSILGHGGGVGMFRDFPGAPLAGTWYVASLANALSGTDVNDSYWGAGTPEIAVAFNSAKTNWYFGTEANPGATELDFVSVALHEIGHGLGFLGTMDYDDGAGTGPNIECNGISGYACWGEGGASPHPGAYDRFAVNAAGQSLINTGLFGNPSTALATQLTTSANVRFNGANAVAANGGLNVRLYCPSTWSPGSSYAHLDENFNGTANALMTYSLNWDEADHDPGPVTLGILRDIGWSISTGCTYSLSSSEASFGPTGGSGSFDVNTDAGCSWTATESLDWVTITSGASGSGHGTVSYTVNSYSGIEAQSGNINAVDKTFVITQTGVLPTADFTSDVQKGDVPFQVTFTDSSSDATSWSWDFGDGGSSTLQNPTHTYRTNSGSPFTVTLTATNINGSHMMTRTSYIVASGCTNGPVRRTGVVPDYTSIQDAYVAIGPGGADTIYIQAVEFSGPAGATGFDQNEDVTLKGGCDCTYSATRIPDTVIEGPLTVSAGTVTFDWIVIK